MTRHEEGCYRAAVDSEGNVHDHSEWYAELEQAHQRIADLERKRDRWKRWCEEARESLDEHGARLISYRERATRAEAELERALKVVQAAEAWRQYSNGTADPDMPVATMLQHFEAAIEALNVAVDIFREGRDGSA